MNLHRPEVFISATSADLRSARDIAKRGLDTIGCHGVTMDEFPPDTRSVRAMLLEKIGACDAVLHIAGEFYGAEPSQRDLLEARRSYTQIEYDIARELDKPIYVFVCAAGFPFDAHAPELAECAALQQAHRCVLTGCDGLYHPVQDPAHLALRVRELQDRVRALQRELQTLAELAGKKHDLLTRQLLEATDAIRFLKEQLEQQSRLTEAILVRSEQEAKSLVVGNAHVPIRSIQAQVATEQNLTIEEIKRRLVQEGSDARSLVILIEQQRTKQLPDQQAAWDDIFRQTLVKLGNAEQNAKRYRQATELFQKALALINLQQDPLGWCGIAQPLSMALYHSGRLTEAEPISRRLVELRSVLQGQEHPDTLTCMANLAILSSQNKDHAAALSLWRKIMEARKQALGHDHRETVMAFVEFTLELARERKIQVALKIDSANVWLTRVSELRDKMDRAITAGVSDISSIDILKVRIGELEAAVQTIRTLETEATSLNSEAGRLLAEATNALGKLGVLA